MSLFVATLAGGCASFKPVITSDRAPSLQTPSAPPSSRARVAIESARPNGLLLNLSYTKGASDPMFDTLELWRAVDNEDARVMNTTTLDDNLRAALVDGLPLLDRDLRQGHHYAYQIVLKGSREPTTEALTSNVVTYRWDGVPQAPKETRARALTPYAIELTWTHDPTLGAIIFRRDLSRDDAKLEKLAKLPARSGSSFVDQTCEPAGLYAYRIAYVREVALAPTALGHLSAMTYAATPPRHD